MGSCASLFFVSGNSDRQTLFRRICLSDVQFESQQERWNLLAEYLVEDLRNRSGYPMATWLQGSYKFGTQIRPVRASEEFDIDLGMYFKWNGHAMDGRFEPVDLKAMVQDSLLAYEGKDVVEVCLPPKTRCSRIRYTDKFHVDVPSYHLDDIRDSRSLATENNSWERSDPKILYLWFKDRFDDQTREKVRRQIRYVKIWAALKFPEIDKRPSSILLTVLIAEAFDGIHAEDTHQDDDLLTYILDEVTSRLEKDRVVRNPVDYNEILTDRIDESEFDAFIDKLSEFNKVAIEANKIDDTIASASKWAEMFDHFFPLPSVEEIMSNTQDSLGLPVPVILPDINVQALHKKSGHRWSGRNRIGPIPIDCDISFTVTNVEAFPYGSEIEWMVRNEGDEAEDINDLGHKAGVGPISTEHSAYRGTHYMDCTVKRFGQVISLRRVPVAITKAAPPLRNPPRKKPHWRVPGKR